MNCSKELYDWFIEKDLEKRLLWFCERSLIEEAENFKKEYERILQELKTNNKSETKYDMCFTLEKMVKFENISDVTLIFNPYYNACYIGKGDWIKEKGEELQKLIENRNKK